MNTSAIVGRLDTMKSTLVGIKKSDSYNSLTEFDREYIENLIQEIEEISHKDTIEEKPQKILSSILNFLSNINYFLVH